MAVETEILGSEVGTEDPIINSGAIGHQHALEVAAIFGHIVVVQPFFTWLEFHNSFLVMYFEHTITIPAIVGHSVLGLG